MAALRENQRIAWRRGAKISWPAMPVRILLYSLLYGGIEMTASLCGASESDGN